MEIPKKIISALVDADVDPASLREFVESAANLPDYIKGIHAEYVKRSADLSRIIRSLDKLIDASHFRDPGDFDLSFDENNEPIFGNQPSASDIIIESVELASDVQNIVPPAPEAIMPPEEEMPGELLTSGAADDEKVSDWQSELWRDKPWRNS